MSETNTPDTRVAAPPPPVGPAPRSFGAVAAGLLRQPRFLVAAGVLLVCAVGFNAAAEYLQVNFRKLPVPMRVRALDDAEQGVPAVIGGRWVQVSEDRPLSGDVEKALGTKQYLNRIYVDQAAVHRTADDLRKLGPKQVNELVFELKQRQPDAVMSVHVAYYTGLVDTVAHIPDRCMVADGYRPTGYDVKPGPAEYADGRARDLRYRFITFEDTTAMARVTRNVGYLFQVNGAYTEDPLEVRRRLQYLLEKYGYYAKVELMTEQAGAAAAAAAAKPDSPAALDARARSGKAMDDFLSALVPHVERCLPDWAQVKAGGSKQ